jgi:hypothetical protein
MGRPKKIDWKGRAAVLLKREMEEREISYSELAERLGSNRVGVTNKINRGAFGTVFLLQCLEAMDVKVLRLGEE